VRHASINRHSQIGIHQAGILHDVVLRSRLEGFVAMIGNDDRGMPALLVTVVTAPNPLENPAVAFQDAAHFFA
jgi:hypothetical protein